MDPKNLNQANYSAKECFNIISEIVNKDRKILEEEADDLKMILMKVFEHLITTENKLEIEELIKLIIAFIQNMKKAKKEKEVFSNEELSKQESEIQLRFVIYEVYKMLNPNRLAGETEIENFLSNVMTRGIEAALYYEKKGISKAFDQKELSILSKNSNSWVTRTISEFGSKGYGKGM